MPGRGREDLTDFQRKAINRELATSEANKRSHKENRVYVGNLSFQVRWNELKDFMRQAGNVVFAEVMMYPDGKSRGCGVVEFSTSEEAARAIREFHDKPFMGRPIFIREDREEQARFGGGNRTNIDNARPTVASTSHSKGVFVSGLKWDVGWQDLKDLFRQAGDVVRADIHHGPDGNPSGSGLVVFTSSNDAANAITMFNGTTLNGMQLEVKEEKFAPPQNGSFGRGGFAGARPSGRPATDSVGRSLSKPVNQIFVKNLPWTTTNEDLVELFETTGQVVYAEVPWENGRSKGFGLVQFEEVSEAANSITRFQGYMYGGRSLGVGFNTKYRDFVAQPVESGGQPVYDD